MTDYQMGEIMLNLTVLVTIHTTCKKLKKHTNQTKVGPSPLSLTAIIPLHNLHALYSILAQRESK